MTLIQVGHIYTQQDKRFDFANFRRHQRGAYGKSKKTENKLLYLAKRSVSKRDLYEIEGATILDVSEDIFSLDGIEGYEDFDLIVSNYLYNGLAEHMPSWRHSKGKAAKARNWSLHWTAWMTSSMTLTKS